MVMEVFNRSVTDVCRNGRSTYNETFLRFLSI